MLKVLIADDEYLVCQFLKKVIDWEKLDMDCVGEALNGIEALQKIQELMPDIVITDIRMPGMSGLDLIERCKKGGLHCHFIITSGYPDFEYVKTAFTQGAVNYLLKPIDEIELENTLIKIKETIQKKTNVGILEKPEAVAPVPGSVQAVDFGKWEILFEILNSDKKALSLQEVNQRYGCCFREEGECNVVAVNISVYDSLKEQYSLCLNLNSKIQDKFHRNITPLCYECQSVIKQDKLFFLLNYSCEQRSVIENEIKDITKKIMRNSELYGAAVFIAMGSGRGSDYGKLYKEAVQALGYKFSPNAENFIRYDSYSFRQMNVYDILNIEWQNRFINIVDTGNAEALKKITGELLRTIKKEKDVDPNVYIQSFDICSSLFSREAKRLFQDFFDERAYKKAMGDILSQSMSIEGLFGRFTDMTEEIYRECLSHVELKEKWPVIKAKQYVEEHYMEKIVLKDLAAKLYLNADYFSSCFKKNAGIGFNDYLRQYRMTIAQQLIRSTDYSLDRVAEMVGYSDPKHFSKSFRKTLGVSPAEYKKFYR